MSHLSDLEMTKLCAEAMGFPNIAHELNQESVHLYKVWPDTPDGIGGLLVYDPLHDDAQAMALVKKFPMDIFADRGNPFWRVRIAADHNAGDGMADDLNRAIVECVAKTQERK